MIDRRSSVRLLRRLLFGAAALTALLLLFGLGESEAATTPPMGSDSGASESGSISGKVWLDDNIDGNRQSGETKGVRRVEAQLLKSGAAHGTPDFTDENGAYEFDDLPQGSYQVRFTLPEGYWFTKKLSTGGHSDVYSSTRIATTEQFNLGPGEDEHKNAGAYEPTGVILVDTTDDAQSDDNKCSLAEALMAAYEDMPADACLAGLDYKPDVIRITVPGTIDAPDHGFEIQSDVTIQGYDRGAGTTIDGDDEVDAGYGVFSVDLRSDSLEVTGVVLADLTVAGSVETVGVKLVEGGTSTRRYTVVLENLRIHRNRVGVQSSRSSSTRPGLIRVVDSVIENNKAGGGILVDSCGSAEHTTEIANSVIRGNAPPRTPALGIMAAYTSPVVILRSTTAPYQETKPNAALASSLKRRARPAQGCSRLFSLTPPSRLTLLSRRATAKAITPGSTCPYPPRAGLTYRWRSHMALSPTTRQLVLRMVPEGYRSSVRRETVLTCRS